MVINPKQLGLPLSFSFFLWSARDVHLQKESSKWGCFGLVWFGIVLFLFLCLNAPCARRSLSFCSSLCSSSHPTEPCLLTNWTLTSTSWTLLSLHCFYSLSYIQPAMLRMQYPLAAAVPPTGRVTIKPQTRGRLNWLQCYPLPAFLIQ